MPRHYRITLADALSAHNRALLYGGRYGVRDITLIESAIARPYSGHHRPISNKLSALVESVACNHGFVDGNKRTAVILMDLLIHKSGYEIHPGPNNNLDQEVERMVLSTVLREFEFNERVEWFKARLAKV